MRLSFDHKGSDTFEQKRISKAGGYILNDRVNGVLAVTRSLGDNSFKEWVIGNPYTTETILKPGDDFLILACDGIWDVCLDQEAVDIVAQIENPKEAAECLVAHALENFSMDNLTVIVVKIDTQFNKKY